MAVSIERATLYEKYRLPYTRQAVTDLLGYLRLSIAKCSRRLR